MSNEIQMIVHLVNHKSQFCSPTLKLNLANTRKYKTKDEIMSMEKNPKVARVCSLGLLPNLTSSSLYSLPAVIMSRPALNHYPLQLSQGTESCSALPKYLSQVSHVTPREVGTGWAFGLKHRALCLLLRDKMLVSEAWAGHDGQGI